MKFTIHIFSLLFVCVVNINNDPYYYEYEKEKLNDNKYICAHFNKEQDDDDVVTLLSLQTSVEGKTPNDNESALNYDVMIIT